MNTITQSEIELSERLRKACLEKGITEPRFVAQDENGDWYHYSFLPSLLESHGQWDLDYDELLFEDEPSNNWRETLMEWNPNARVPLAEVIEYTCEHCGQRI